MVTVEFSYHCISARRPVVWHKAYRWRWLARFCAWFARGQTAGGWVDADVL